MGAKISKENLLAVAVVGLLLLFWEAVVDLLRIPQFLIPAPTQVFLALQAKSDLLAQGLLITAFETLTGFLLASLVAIVSALLITASRTVYSTLYPLLLILQLLPKTAIAPLLIIYFGYGNLPTIVLAFLISFFPIFVNTAQGLVAVEPEILDVARYLRASSWQRLMKIRLPNSIPYMLTGMKVGITLALVGAVVAEFIASQSGLGYVIIVASNNLETSVGFAAILLITVVGMGLYLAMIVLERLLTPWQKISIG